MILTVNNEMLMQKIASKRNILPCEPLFLAQMLDVLLPLVLEHRMKLKLQVRRKTMFASPRHKYFSIVLEKLTLGRKKGRRGTSGSELLEGPVPGTLTVQCQQQHGLE